MKLITRLSMLFLALFAAQSNADTFGGSFEVNYWMVDYTGDVTIDQDSIGLGRETGLGSTEYFDVAAFIEHPIPFVPNLKVRHSDLKETGKGNFTGAFDGRAFSDANTTTFDVTNTDGIVYYEILDNWFELDLGVAVKIFDGVFDIEDQSEPDDFSNTVIDEVVPMLYLAMNFNFPSSDYVFGTDILITSIEDSQVHDYKIRFKQDWGYMYGELGWRELRVDIEDIDELDLDLTLSGYYVGLGVDF